MFNLQSILSSVNDIPDGQYPGVVSCLDPGRVKPARFIEIHLQRKFWFDEARTALTDKNRAGGVLPGFSNPFPSIIQYMDGVNPARFLFFGFFTISLESWKIQRNIDFTKNCGAQKSIRAWRSKELLGWVDLVVFHRLCRVGEVLPGIFIPKSNQYFSFCRENQSIKKYITIGTKESTITVLLGVVVRIKIGKINPQNPETISLRKVLKFANFTDVRSSEYHNDFAQWYVIAPDPKSDKMLEISPNSELEQS